jgi:hypothetical protein
MLCIPAGPDAYKPNRMGLLPEGRRTDRCRIQPAWQRMGGRPWPWSVHRLVHAGGRVAGGQAYSNADPVDQGLYKAQERQKFERLAGSPEIAAQRMANAAKLLAKGDPAFTEGLRQSGALHSAQVITMLALEWERMQMRG